MDYVNVLHYAGGKQGWIEDRCSRVIVAAKRGNLSLLEIVSVAVLYHDLPRTYHDHDCIPGHPSDYPRL